MDDLGLNLAWLNDSLSSSLSNTIQDINSNSNLNSASSLSWAEDEVENHATLKVQQCLDSLEEYLLSGQTVNGVQKMFDLAEATLWRNLIVNFKLEDLLNQSRHCCDQEQGKVNPLKEGLVVHGHSTSMHPLSSKLSSPTFTHYQAQTPRIHSAHPAKPAIQPPRARSAYPLKSPTLPSLTARAGARSGNPSARSLRGHHKNSDYYKLLNDTARLEISTVSTKIQSPVKSSGTQIRRLKLQPPVLPKLSDLEPESVTFSPLNESKATFRNNRTKAKLNPVPFVTSLKSPSFYGRSSTNERKSTSAAQHRNLPLTKTGQSFSRPVYSMPSRSINGRSEINLSIELVGTSLSLFEPIVRSARPIIMPKLRTST